eukprot:4785920-Alexandrium_andersonii.AAC.1
MPLLVQLCLTSRLRQQRMQAATVLYDLTNAFFCGQHSGLTAAISTHARADDRQLLASRVQDARLSVTVGPDSALLAVGSGAPPGDSTAADFFGLQFYPQLHSWLAETQDLAIWSSVPGWENDVDVGFTNYADDLARTILFGNVPSLHRSLRLMDLSLDAHLASQGFVQNSSKKEILPFLA